MAAGRPGRWRRRPPDCQPPSSGVVMWRLDRGTLRAAGFVALLVTVFLTVNTSVAYAATSASAQGGLLSPLELDTSEGVSIKGYELGAQGGSVFSLTSNWQAMILSGLFTVVRVLVGLACWAIEVAYRFPLLKLLTMPAQRLSEIYTETVVDDLGLKSMLLTWAFVFGLVLVVLGKHAKGFGEIALTLVIGALAASVFITPTFLLGKEGPIQQAQSAAAEVAQKTVNAHAWGGKISSDDPCATVSGPAYQTCYDTQDAKTPEAQKIAKPIQDAVTNSLVVKPFMLLQYGRILDPAHPSDRKAYQVHLKWVSGGYDTNGSPKKEDKDDPCRLIKGPAGQYCEREPGDKGPDTLPELTPGGKLLDEVAPVLSKDDQEFAAFLKDLKAAGPVGKDCAEYAAEPTWWRVAGVVMVFIAALLICALLLSAAMVLVGITAVCAGAAASGGVCFVWGMLPGPSRSAVWKWLALFGISMAMILAIATFIPAVGITIDVILTDGPDLLAERLLLIDVVALVGLAFHRRLLMVITSFSQRLTLRMRYAKIGGSHMTGDSQLGAALAMSGVGGSYFTSGSLRGHGRTGLSTAGLLQGVLGGATDGAGMPGDPARLLADANAEASRGLAPMGAAVLGARLAAGGAWAVLVGKNPGAAKLNSLRKPTADADSQGSANGQPSTPSGQSSASSGRLTRAAGGPRDRYRDEDGQIIDPDTGEILHDQKTDRTLLSTRAHNRLVRLRGYRIAHHGGRLLYGATMGLPVTARTVQAGVSRATGDTRQQLRVWSNTLRQDGRSWGSMLQQPSGQPLPSSGRITGTSSSTTARPVRATAAAAAPSGRTGTSGSSVPSPAAATPWSTLTAPSGPGAASARLNPASGGAGTAATSPGAVSPRPRPNTTPPAQPQPGPQPPPAGSTGRVSGSPRRPSGGLGSSDAARQAAQDMFRRIQETNARSPRPADDTDQDGGDDE
ncbi:hypothetical protein ACFC96_44550 [Streptomyces sp. NPDC055955]|uniref:hypothetical protein n=1 Tax=Streptomyces sp. NPDC055955 TaxID=3345665 RepID=UPI0035D83E29